MSRVFVTGDTHFKEEYQKVERLCEIAETDKDDFLIILGDHGCNYYGEKKDRRMKKYLESLPISFVLVKGNHDQRPSRKLCDECYVIDPCVSGRFLIDKEFPSILYPQMFGSYSILNKPAFIMGGAYSVDKWYRLQMYEQGYKQYRWFPDEQLSPKEMDACRKEIYEKTPHGGWEYIFTHTCPLKYEPYDKFLTRIDQTQVDKSMEKFFGELESTVKYKKWFCGHYHLNRTTADGKCTFMYNDVILLGDTEDRKEENNESESD